MNFWAFALDVVNGMNVLQVACSDVAKVCLFVVFFLYVVLFCFVLSFNHAANYLSFQIYFDDMDIFKNYCVVYERHKTVPQIRVVPIDRPQNQYVIQVLAAVFDAVFLLP